MAERLVTADASPLIGLAAAKNARLAHSISNWGFFLRQVATFI